MAHVDDAPVVPAVQITGNSFDKLNLFYSFGIIKPGEVVTVEHSSTCSLELETGCTHCDCDPVIHRADGSRVEVKG